jgi:DNA-binding NarL/FixJ family response regulator
MRVLIADDHALLRMGLKLIVAQIDPEAVCVEAADGREAVEMARREAADLCLLDLTMPGLNGLDALPQLQQVAPRMRVLVLSMHASEPYVAAAMRAGAQGYLLKDSAVDELADAIKALREGRSYISRALTDALLPAYLRQLNRPGATAPEEPLTQLTPRQREVLQLLAEGHSTRALAERLNLSVKTVETHRAEIGRRLGISDIAGLTRYAVRIGLVSSDR